MNVAVTVATALIGFAIAAGPALVVTLMDMGKEREAKKAAQSATASTSATEVRESTMSLA